MRPRRRLRHDPSSTVATFVATIVTRTPRSDDVLTPSVIGDLAQVGLAYVLDDCQSEPPPVLAQSLRRHQLFRARYPLMTQTEPSLWHATCTHRQYNVSCEQFDDLLVTARFACQLCRQTSDRLVIDHDHALGWWAVRGLLCHWCNSHMGRVDAGSAPRGTEVSAYLASPPAWRRDFDYWGVYATATVVGRWERAYSVPLHLRIGSGTNHWMNRAIRLVRTNGSSKPPYSRKPDSVVPAPHPSTALLQALSRSA